MLLPCHIVCFLLAYFRHYVQLATEAVYRYYVPSHVNHVQQLRDFLDFPTLALAFDFA